MIPVSLRADGDTTVGNPGHRPVPRLGEPQAAVAQRIEQIVESVQIAKKRRRRLVVGHRDDLRCGAARAGHPGAQTRVDQLTPPACNLVISNVPGIKETRYLNGAELLGIYPISALAASIGLNVTLSSYHDHMDFGFVANTASISDVSALADPPGRPTGS